MLVAAPIQWNEDQHPFSVIQKAASKLFDVLYLTIAASNKQTYRWTTSQLLPPPSFSRISKTDSGLHHKYR